VGVTCSSTSDRLQHAVCGDDESTGEVNPSRFGYPERSKSSFTTYDFPGDSVIEPSYGDFMSYWSANRGQMEHERAVIKPKVKRANKRERTKSLVSLPFKFMDYTTPIRVHHNHAERSKDSRTQKNAQGEEFSSRIWRNEFPMNDQETDIQLRGNICKLKETGSPLITLDDDRRIIISHKAYFDDVLAFVLGCVKTNPNIPLEIKRLLGKCIDLADERHFAPHGHHYSHSGDETRTYRWTTLERLFDRHVCRSIVTTRQLEDLSGPYRIHYFIEGHWNDKIYVGENAFAVPDPPSEC
jgi:hypothetical protein